MVVMTERYQDYAVVRINRPDVLNALNADVLDALESAYSQLEDDVTIRVVVLTGTGDKAFVAGADINVLNQLPSAAEAEAFSRQGQRVFNRIAESRLVTVVAINGYALGGGLELAMAGDIRIMADHAQVGQPEILLGIIPGFGGTQRLARLAGEGAALLWILTGDRVGAQEALRLRVVDRVCAADRLMDEATTLAKTLAQRPPIAVKLAKRAIRQGLGVHLAAGLDLEAALFGVTANSLDAKEGTGAFLEKRQARFQGR